MSRITKDIAQRVARNLVAKKEEQNKELKIAIDTLIKEHYTKTLPKEVIKLYETFQKYLVLTSTVHLHGQGIDQNYYNLGYNIYVISENNNNPHITFEKKEAAVLEKMLTKYKSTQAEIKNLKIEIEALLFACRTYKKAIETFPECKEFLPDANAAIYLPTINVDNLRKRLK